MNFVVLLPGIFVWYDDVNLRTTALKLNLLNMGLCVFPLYLALLFIFRGVTMQFHTEAIKPMIHIDDVHADLYHSVKEPLLK